MRIFRCPQHHLTAVDVNGILFVVPAEIRKKDVENFSNCLLDAVSCLKPDALLVFVKSLYGWKFVKMNKWAISFLLLKKACVCV